MSKILDLLDTLILALDKRFEQVSYFNVFYDGFVLFSGEKLYDLHLANGQ